MSPMHKTVVVAALEEIARYLELGGENRFRAQAYERAARSLEQVSGDITELVESGRLTTLPNVGKGIAPIVEEIVRTGSSPYLEELRGQFPPGIFELMRVPSLGVGKIRTLHDALGISSLDDLRSACESGSLTGVPGFGAKTAAKICEALAKLTDQPERFLLHDAVPLAERLADQLRAVAGVRRVEVAGSVRRRLETVGNIDLVAAVKSVSGFARAIVSEPSFDAGAVDAAAGIWTGRVAGMPVRLRFVPEKQLASVLVGMTGSAAWLERVGFTGAESSEVAQDEEPADLPWFRSAGVGFVEPELREAEHDAVSSPTLLVRREDLTGTFHAHTTWSDGKHSVEEMISAAASRGLAYLGLTDHSRTAAYAGGLTEDQVRLQQAEIEAVRERHSIRVFRGSEVDILSDGDLDYTPSTLDRFDFIVASVHSRFSMDADTMTERIVQAVRNPYTTFLGHLSGRKLLVREPYAIDYRRIFEAAAEHGVIVEINGNPQRLDVDWRLLRLGLDCGVTYSIHPDAHSVAAIDHLRNGVWNARKGGLEPKHIFNTRPLEQIEEYLSARKS